MKRKYRESMRAAARQMHERPDDVDDEAIEARDWHDEWVAVAPEQRESNNNHWSQE